MSSDTIFKSMDTALAELKNNINDLTKSGNVLTAELMPSYAQLVDLTNGLKSIQYYPADFPNIVNNMNERIKEITQSIKNNEYTSGKLYEVNKDIERQYVALKMPGARDTAFKSVDETLTELKNTIVDLTKAGDVLTAELIPSYAQLVDLTNGLKSIQYYPADLPNIVNNMNERIKDVTQSIKNNEYKSGKLYEINKDIERQYVALKMPGARDTAFKSVDETLTELKNTIVDLTKAGNVLSAELMPSYAQLVDLTNGLKSIQYYPADLANIVNNMNERVKDVTQSIKNNEYKTGKLFEISKEIEEQYVKLQMRGSSLDSAVSSADASSAPRVPATQEIFPQSFDSKEEFGPATPKRKK